MARTTLGLFLLFQAIYALTSSGNAFRIPDEFEVYFQTENLFDNGDVSVPQTLLIRQPRVVDGKVVGTDSVFFGKVGLDGKPYAPYGPGAAVLALPHHAVGRALASMLGIPRSPPGQGLAWVIFVGGVTMLATATAAALAVAGFYRAVVALGTPALPALRLSLLLGGASVLWPYGATLYTEAWQAAAMIWAAALLLEARSTAHARSRVVLAAVLLAVMGLTKVTSLVFAPAFVIAALADVSRPQRERLQVAGVLALGIAVATAAQLAWNNYRFGSIAEFGYDWSETIPVLPPQAFSLTDLPRGLIVLLFTPGKSIFLWAPLLMLAALNVPRVWARDRALTIGVAAAFVVGLVFFAAYLFPEGGYSHGPRNLVPVVPLVALLAAGPDATRWPTAALIACAIVGGIMAVLATSVSFLEDQALRTDAAGRPVIGYYELIEPAPGRPNNRYRLGYVPFVTAMGTPGWSGETPLGQGPDYFPLHLGQARRQLPDGRTIPPSVVWWWPAMWAALAAGAAIMLRAPRVTEE
ncbi:MAG TPA: hypothetical protein VFZ38_14670 [Vicinamibacterales bacterium]